MNFKYSKYVPNPLDDLDMEELMSKLSDLLLSSGFDNPWDPGGGMDRTMQALHDAILEALFSRGVLPPDVVDKLFGEQAEGSEEDLRQQLEQLIDQIIQRMQESGYITGAPDLEAERQRRAQGGGGGEGEPQQVQFEVTDKALDFLGFRALRDLLGSLGHSSAGRHDTRDLSTGVETSGAPKPYEFGDTLNIDGTATILNAVTRQAAERNAIEEGAGPARLALGQEAYQPEPGTAPAVTTSGIDIDYQDLMVAQGEYQSSCATVLMLDCSHSMILYGEDALHYAEKLAGRRQFGRWALTPSGIIECAGLPGSSDGFEAIAPRLSQLVRRYWAGKALMQAIPMVDLIQIALTWLREDSLALLCDHSYCERCRSLPHDGANLVQRS